MTVPYKLFIEDDPGWMGDPKRGAGMGRPDSLPENRHEAVVKLHLNRVRGYDDGDYDKGGCYWGDLWRHPLYCAEGWINEGELNEEHVRLFVRAADHAEAIVEVRKTLPKAVFFG